jgi:capsule polysaccharide export protein KpsE/RkpR
MALTKDSIAKLEIADELKADILALFGQIETQQTEVESIRKKLPTDSQKIVESVDYEKFQTATAELERLKTEMAAKLQNEAGEEGETFLAAFSAFFR